LDPRGTQPKQFKHSSNNHIASFAFGRGILVSVVRRDMGVHEKNVNVTSEALPQVSFGVIHPVRLMERPKKREGGYCRWIIAVCRQGHG
jgi:hypothetical protein